MVVLWANDKSKANGKLIGEYGWLAEENNHVCARCLNDRC